MATREAKRRREVLASQRIDAAVTAMAPLLGVTLPADGPKAKDPELRAIQRWEWLAAVLEQVVTALHEAREGRRIAGAEPTAAAPRRRERS